MGLRALALIILLFTAPSAAPAADTAPWTGFNDISSVAGAVPFDTAAQAAADAGATSTRVVVDWSWLEAVPGRYTWGVLDGAYWSNVDRGIRPLIGITGAPRWAWARSARCPAARHCAFPPGRAHHGDYRELLRRLTRRYPQAVAIEVGNEPNLRWAWAGGLSPARYTKLLIVAHQAIKSVNPAMPVLSGGLAPVLGDVRTPREIGLRRYLEAMYAHGAKGHMDGIAIHPYPGSIDFDKSFAALSIVKDVRSANGDSVPLWITEFGLTTSRFSADDQATALAALATALRSDPEIEGVYAHTLYDDPSNPIPDERGYGFMSRDQTPKPAYCAMARASGLTPGCAAPAPSATRAARWEAQVLLQAAADAARRVRLATGTYDGLTAAALHEQDARISRNAAVGALLPGPTADPSRIAVYPVAPDGLVLCNTSQGDRSYCIGTRWRKRWAYTSSPGRLFVTAGALLQGTSTGWR